jgi:S1-C subfamily serine protease
VIRDFDDLKKQIGRHRPGDKTTLVLIRPGPLQSTSLRKAEETEFDLKAEDHALGIEITDIDEDSAWYKVGMRAGDVINVLNNESVKTAAEAMEAFKKIAAGEVVNIVFYRKPDKRPASITFGAWK